jgi:fluoride exporter
MKPVWQCKEKQANGSKVGMTVFVLVAVGGAIGSVCRYLISTRIQRQSGSGFPWGTYVVNGSGSFLIGIVFGLFDATVMGDDLLIFLVAGVLGGYTTFSTFSVENMHLLENRRYLWLLHNTFGQIAGGLLLAALGYWLGTAVI